VEWVKLPNQSRLQIDRSGVAIGTGALGVRTVATGLLLVMAAILVGTSFLIADYPWAGFVRAFAEAGLVGGLADWFAVTALFRHPLGIPIPHTAIIPRNKDRIGDTLASFIRNNFLVPKLIALRMRRIDIAGAVGRFLADPSISEGRMRGGASRLIADMVGSLDQDRLGGMVKGALADRLRALDISPLLGQTLRASMADGRHQPLIDGFVGWANKTLSANDHLIKEMVHERANALLRFTGIDETIANSIINGLHKLLDDMSGDPDHPLRHRVEEGLAKLAEDLQHDAVMQERVGRIRDEILDNPAIKRWLDGLWEQARGALLKAARDPQSALAGKLGDMLRQLGNTLIEDERLKTAINRLARRAVVGGVESYGDSAVRLVSDTVRSWDVDTLTERLETAVGDDLQYIRINGTLVGGLVGVAIHIAEVAL
jgi:uncharacterized membrane-anchored protein YjiN (DUF445 family)